MLQILCAAPPTQNNGTKTLKCESEVLISERNFHKSENQSNTQFLKTHCLPFRTFIALNYCCFTSSISLIVIVVYFFKIFQAEHLDNLCNVIETGFLPTLDAKAHEVLFHILAC